MLTIYDEIRDCIRLMYVGNVFYAAAIATTKVSIVASYLRIFPGKTFRLVMYITAGIVICHGVAAIPAMIFQCSPISAAWDFTIQGARCYPLVNYLYASTGINIVTDLVLCIYPVPYFWKLNLPRKQKFILSALFFVGGFAAVATTIRLVFLRTMGDGVDITCNVPKRLDDAALCRLLMNSPDNLVGSLLWTIAECAIGIICVSLPPLRPLLASILPNTFRVFTSKANATPTPKRVTGASGPIRHFDSRGTTKDESETLGTFPLLPVPSNKIYVQDRIDWQTDPSSSKHDQQLKGGTTKVTITSGDVETPSCIGDERSVSLENPSKPLT
ncbi:hypothetical protein S7711_08888 [Stachybotrys chartarum IBT 7711]|uniref:Rhodopsin domain-containing protein n=1 Tax=Stachybotrys chartarum (strain CBS 109288 / IBT 7711) TaxID=1280523 RepID=A0A084AL91_STACB|nr:hypothetical protein S7711_08888 [Stachybotrys chartarum IBT 7711]